MCSNFDGWKLVATSQDAPDWHDAFTGNGRMGFRIPPEGETSPYPELCQPFMAPGGTLKLGFWEYADLLPVFNFTALELNIAGWKFRRGVGIWHDYSQTLDWRTGEVTTHLVWEIAGQRAEIEIRFLPYRNAPELAVTELALTAQTPLWGTVTDRVDAAFMPQLSNAGHFGNPADAPERALCYFAHIGANAELAAAATILECDKNRLDAVENLFSEKRMERKLSFHLAADEVFRVKKFAAFTHEKEVSNPICRARTIVSFALKQGEKLREKHEAIWRELWRHDIEIDRPEYQKIVRNALFQLYASLAPGASDVPGPVGLSATHWHGHAFWDDEAWMFPVVALLNPALGRCFLEYRLKTLAGAHFNAKSSGNRGARFAWESAASGVETIPDLIYAEELHITAFVALAAWQFYLISGDKAILERFAPLILEGAEFWLSRLVWNDCEKCYELKKVCCTDEYAGIQDNHTMTNFAVIRHLEIARRVREILGLAPDARYEERIARIKLPFDGKEQIYREFEGYNGEVIKQADTVLCIYPWEMTQSNAMKRRTTDYYRRKYPPGAIMMGSTIDGIIDAELGDAAGVAKALDSLKPHFRGEFMIATESPLNEVGSFLTGLGGLLQLAVMGMGGLRLSEKGLFAHPPCLAPGVSEIVLHNVTWQGVEQSIRITGEKAEFFHE